MCLPQQRALAQTPPSCHLHRRFPCLAPAIVDIQRKGARPFEPQEHGQPPRPRTPQPRSLRRGPVQARRKQLRGDDDTHGRGKQGAYGCRHKHERDVSLASLDIRIPHLMKTTSDRSSRSHAVFTLLLSMRRHDPDTNLDTEKVSRIRCVFAMAAAISS